MSTVDHKSQRCSAQSKAKGQQCGRAAIPGGTVCRYHGGAAPQVKKAAEARLRAMVDPALGVLEFAMKRKAKDIKAALTAAREVLDRAKPEGGDDLAAKSSITVTFVKP